jgi:glutamate formiminotransferase / formiminotetrahydrofolate cyclodeaminase
VERIVECVPNFSEGRDPGIIDAIARSISSTPGAFLLGVDPGADANRTVYTFAGGPEAVLAAALAAARAARELIDMSRHSGEHPRMGALDVCPFVPVSGVSMEDCVALSKSFGEELAGELGVPVYLYERSASRPGRRSLAAVRSGGYEGLAARLASPEWAPDFGPASFVPSWGATAAGAREFLIAYNVNLDTRDAGIAREIAARVRESGRAARGGDGKAVADAEGRTVRIPGLLKAVRAIGWYMEGYGRAQVSMNLLDYRRTGLREAYEVVASEAAKLGRRATGSELVGLAPLAAVAEAGRRCLGGAGGSEGSGGGRASEPPGDTAGERELVGAAVRGLGLDELAPFDPEARIFEYALTRRRRSAG